MKTCVFSCLPEQLFQWARQSGQYVPGLEINESMLVELLFTSLFPDIHDYAGCLDSCRQNGLGSEERSIEIRHYYKRFPRNELFPVYDVHITDTMNGVQSALERLKHSGLLKGEELIEQRRLEAEEEYRAEKKSENTSNIVLGIVTVIVIVVGLSVFAHILAK